MAEIRRRPLPRHGTDHDSNRCHRFRGLSTSTPASVPTRRVSKWSCDRARVRPQSARAAICRRPVTTNSPSGALSSFPRGGFSSSFCTPCGASTVDAAALWLSKKFPGATANAHGPKPTCPSQPVGRGDCHGKRRRRPFAPPWDKVFDAVEHVVIFGLEHRVPGKIDAIGVDEIQYAKGHKVGTLLIREKCSEALPILDRFHIVAKCTRHWTKSER